MFPRGRIQIGDLTDPQASDSVFDQIHCPDGSNCALKPHGFCLFGLHASKRHLDDGILPRTKRHQPLDKELEQDFLSPQPDDVQEHPLPGKASRIHVGPSETSRLTSDQTGYGGKGEIHIRL